MPNLEDFIPKEEQPETKPAPIAVLKMEKVVVEIDAEEVQIKVKELVAQGLQDAKGDKGDDGYTPQKGVDYFTDEEKQQFIKSATPIKGKHYFDGISLNKDEIVKEVIQKIPKAKDGKSVALEEVVSAVLPLIPKPKDGKPGKDGTSAGGRTRSKSFLKFVTATGAINGVNTIFYLSEAPASADQILWMLDNTPQEKTQNYSLKSNVLTYTFPPQPGQRHWGMVYRA